MTIRNGDEFIGRFVTYPLNNISNPRVYGRAIFEELIVDDVTEFVGNPVKITLELTSILHLDNYQAYICMNSTIEGGPILISLNSINVDSGKSVTCVYAYDDGTAVNYNTLLTLNGHISIINPSTVIVQGNIGKHLAQVSVVELIELEYSMFFESLKLTGLESIIKDTNYECTIFAPTNSAFENLLINLELNNLSDVDVNMLTEILKHHIILTNKKFTDLLAIGSVKSINDYNLTFTNDLANKKLNDSYFIDIDFDFPDTILHVIDKVLVKRQLTLPDIVDVLSANTKLDVLVKALVSTNLISTLRSSGPYTLFAPTDDAFSAYDMNEQLTIDILLNHIVPITMNSIELLPIQRVDTLLDEELLIEVEDDIITVNNSAEIVITDLIAKNGIIHIIDDVILPISYAKQ